MKLIKLIRIKKFILLYAITFLGIFISTFSSPIPCNFWDKVQYMLGNPWLVVCVLAGVFMLAYETYGLNTNQNIYLRQGNIITYQKKNCKSLFLLNLLYLFLVVITCVIVGIICSFGDFSIGLAQNASVPIYIYLIFFLIRITIVYNILSYFFYLLLWNIKLVFIVIIYFAFVALIVFGGSHYYWIESLIESPFLIIFYLKYLQYADFAIELFSSIVQIIIWVYICFFLFIYTFKKSKKDLLK